VLRLSIRRQIQSIRVTRSICSALSLRWNCIAVCAAACAALIVLGCAASPSTSERASSDGPEAGAESSGSETIDSEQRTIVPVGLRLIGLDGAPHEEMGVDDAIARRDALLSSAQTQGGLAAGDRTWFFHAFDGETLEFVEASYDPEPPADPPMKRTARYQVERIVVVPRTDTALDELGVADTIAMYEEGVCGITVGMPAADVEAAIGTPDDVRIPTRAGCELHTYGDLQLTMCFDEVDYVSLPERGRCP